MLNSINNELLGENRLQKLIYIVENQLLNKVVIKSVNPFDPVKVYQLPEPWSLVGTGNYAAAVYHPEFSDWIIKIYADGRPGIEEEVYVYRKLGYHSSYSQCFHHGKSYLILKRLEGITLYDCLKKGIKINEQVIIDVDEALEYAKKQGLHPHDVHVKNVMIVNGRGVVVDVSDFSKEEYCSLWEDLKHAYYKFYRVFLYRICVPIPHVLLELIRKVYRFNKNLNKQFIKLGNKLTR